MKTSRQFLIFCFLLSLASSTWCQEIPGDSTLLEMLYGTCKKQESEDQFYAMLKSQGEAETWRDSSGIEMEILLADTFKSGDVLTLFVVSVGVQAYFYGHRHQFPDLYYLVYQENAWVIDRHLTDDDESDGWVDVRECEILTIGSEKSAVSIMTEGSHLGEEHKNMELYELKPNGMNYLGSFDLFYANTGGECGVNAEKGGTCSCTSFEAKWNLLTLPEKEEFDLELRTKHYTFTEGCEKRVFEKEVVHLYEYIKGTYSLVK